jgi:phytol kinase
MSVHVPLLLFTQTGRAETLLIAATLGLLATLLEAISWKGLDNLLVPLGAFILLKAFLVMDVPTLAGRLALAGGCVIFGILWRRRTTLDGGAVLGAALVGYIAWALGDWRWLLPPLTVFLSYTLLWPKSDRERRLADGPHNAHNAHAVASVAAVGLLWLFTGRLSGRTELFFFPYTLSFAVHLALIGVGRVCRRYPKMSPLAVLTTSALAGWALLFLPFVAVQQFHPSALLCALAAVPVVAAACAAFYRTQPVIHDCPADIPRWLRQGAYAAASSLLGFLVVYAGR